MRPKLTARAVVDALLAPPVNHPRTLQMPIQQRAIKRHAFQRAAFEAAFTQRPRIISVVGTKGKGSVSELLRSALGTKVGCFTSPHLHGCRERIRVGAEPISVEALRRNGEKALELARKLEADDWGCVFFDRLLATALLHFGEEACPRLVLEAGVGGIHDSTNFFTDQELELAVITSISLDHTALLGDTLTEIATNKAGVMRPKTKAVTPSTQPLEALEALNREADRVGAELVVVDCSGTSEEPSTKRENRLLASKACALLNVEADFSSSKWPARFEEIRVHGRLVIIDAAHNGDSVAKFLEAAHMKFPSTKFTVVFGCGAEKEGLEAMVDAVRPFERNVVCVEAGSSFADRPLPPSKRGEPAQLLAARVGANAAFEPSVAAALSNSAGPVLVCGSVYVAGEAREWCVAEDPACLPADDWARTLRDDML
jgi:dihydrofolate synthase/folylpolyglutamate synthase